DAARRGCRHEITTVDALPRHSGDRRVAAGPGLGSGTDAGAAWLLAMLSISTVPVPIAGAPSSSHPRPEATDGLAIAPPGSPQPGAPRHPGSGAPGPPARGPSASSRGKLRRMARRRKFWGWGFEDQQPPREEV